MSLLDSIIIALREKHWRLYVFRAGAPRTPESSDKATITSCYSPCKPFSLIPFSSSAVTYNLLKLFIKTCLLSTHTHRNDGHITLSVSRQRMSYQGTHRQSRAGVWSCCSLLVLIVMFSLILMKTTLWITVSSSNFEAHLTKIQPW